MIRAKENLVTKQNSTVVGVGRVAVPFAPPPSASVTRGTVVGVTAKEINGESTAGATVGSGRAGKAALEVDRNKIPARAEGTLRKIADEKHAVGTGQNGVKEEGWRGGYRGKGAGAERIQGEARKVVIARAV